MSHPRIEFVKTAVLCIGVLAGCTAELFHTPSEIRGVWDLQNHGRILDISERGIAVYDTAGAKGEKSSLGCPIAGTPFVMKMKAIKLSLTTETFKS